MNPYEILDIDKYATVEEIKTKYRQLASENHPDKGGDNEKFALINLAYDVLTDPIKRKGYDDEGILFTDSTTYKEAKEVLERLFNESINRLDPEKDNLVVMMQLQARTKKTHLEAQMEACLKAIDKLKRVDKKIKQKQKSENFILNFVENGMKNCEHDLKIIRQGLKIYDYVLIVLNNYHYSDYDWMEMLTNDIPSQST